MRMLLFVGLFFSATGCVSNTPSPEPGSGEGCHSPVGFIQEGHTAVGYLHQIESAGQSCKQGTLRCENGQWSGAFIYPTCVVTP